MLTKYAAQSLAEFGLYRQLSRKRRIWNLRKLIGKAEPLNVILGAGPTQLPGWIQTDKDILDVTSAKDWHALFEPDSIDSLLSEHMLEHLSEQEAGIALGECYRYLRPGGLFRIAVPDGYRRDSAYVAEVAPPHDGHQVLYNIDTLTALLSAQGFSVSALEYFDRDENFHALPWDQHEGLIMRSVRFDRQLDFQRGDLYYTSLIVDARKQ